MEQPPAIEIPRKRVNVYIDGQNLYYSAKDAFGCSHPDYDPLRLAVEVCEKRQELLASTAHYFKKVAPIPLENWSLHRLYMYTGVPSDSENYWHKYWTAKLRNLERNKEQVSVTKGQVQYREHQYDIENQRMDLRVSMYLPNGVAMPPGTRLLLPNGRDIDGRFVVRSGAEKGIDVKIALDLVLHALEGACDVAVIFSQDQDLKEAVAEAKKIANRNARMLKVYSAFPLRSDQGRNLGIGSAMPMLIDKDTYARCVDPDNSKYLPQRA